MANCGSLCGFLSRVLQGKRFDLTFPPGREAIIRLATPEDTIHPDSPHIKSLSHPPLPEIHKQILLPRNRFVVIDSGESEERLGSPRLCVVCAPPSPSPALPQTLDCLPFCTFVDWLSSNQLVLLLPLKISMKVFLIFPEQRLIIWRFYI